MIPPNPTLRLLHHRRRILPLSDGRPRTQRRFIKCPIPFRRDVGRRLSCEARERRHIYGVLIGFVFAASKPGGRGGFRSRCMISVYCAQDGNQKSYHWGRKKREVDQGLMELLVVVVSGSTYLPHESELFPRSLFLPPLYILHHPHILPLFHKLFCISSRSRVFPMFSARSSEGMEGSGKIRPLDRYVKIGSFDKKCKNQMTHRNR